MLFCSLFVLLFISPDKVNFFFFLGEKEAALLNIKFVIGQKHIPYYLSDIIIPNVLWYSMSVISHSYSVFLF